jgi:hypothetical protein
VRRIEPVVFWALVALHLGPIWTLPVLATQDGPAHLANASVLRQLLEGGCPVVSEFYTVNARLLPNWLSHLLLAGLQLLVPPLAAEKVVQTACVVGVAASVRGLLHALSPRPGWLAPAALPLAFASPFLMGFYGFCLALAVSFGMLGLWVRRGGELGPRRAAALGGLALVAAFLHLVPLLAGALVLACLVLFRARAAARASSRPGAGWAAARRLGLPLALALAPALAVCALFLAEPAPGGRYLWQPLATGAGRLVRGEILVAFGGVERAFATGFVLCLAAAALATRRAGRAAAPAWLRGGLLAASGLFLLGSVALPDFLPRGGYLGARLAWLGCALLLAWLAAHPLPRSAALALGVALAVSSLGLLGAKLPSLAASSAAVLDQLAAAREIEAGTTVLPIALRRRGRAASRAGARPPVDPLLHAANYLAAGRCLVVLDNYEAGFARHFPTLFAPELNPYRHAGYSAYRPERVELARYRRETGRPIDYVLATGTHPPPARLPPARRQALERVLAELERDYELVSHGGGAMRLYRRRDFPRVE